MMFEIDPKKIKQNEENIEIYKINIKKGTNILALTNIIFYNNRNDTLPVGMDYSTNVFVDLRRVQILNVATKTNNIIELSESSPEYVVKKLKITEFSI